MGPSCRIPGGLSGTAQVGFLLALCCTAVAAFNVPQLITPKPPPNYSDFVRCAGTDRYLFSATTHSEGRELYILDGPSGPVTMVPLESGRNGSDPTSFLALSNGYILFVATTSANGTELWTSDCTVEGTRLLYDATPGPASTNILQPLLYSANESAVPMRTTPNQLVFTDGMVVSLTQNKSTVFDTLSTDPIACKGGIFVTGPGGLRRLFKVGEETYPGPGSYQLEEAKRFYCHNHTAFFFSLYDGRLGEITDSLAVFGNSLANYTMLFSVGGNCYVYVEGTGSVHRFTLAGGSYAVAPADVTLYSGVAPLAIGNTIYFAKMNSRAIVVEFNGTAFRELFLGSSFEPTGRSLFGRFFPLVSPLGDAIAVFSFGTSRINDLPYAPNWIGITATGLKLLGGLEECSPAASWDAPMALADFTSTQFLTKYVVWTTFSGVNGTFLARSDGSQVEFVFDAEPGEENDFSTFAIVPSSLKNRRLYFTFWDSRYGSEVWSTNGTDFILYDISIDYCDGSNPRLERAAKQGNGISFIVPGDLGGLYIIESTGYELIDLGGIVTHPDAVCNGYTYVVTVDGGSGSSYIARFNDSIVIEYLVTVDANEPFDGPFLCTTEGNFIFFSNGHVDLTNSYYMYDGINVSRTGMMVDFVNPNRATLAQAGSLILYNFSPSMGSPEYVMSWNSTSNETGLFISEYGVNNYEVIKLDNNKVLSRSDKTLWLQYSNGTNTALLALSNNSGLNVYTAFAKSVVVYNNSVVMAIQSSDSLPNRAGILGFRLTDPWPPITLSDSNLLSNFDFAYSYLLGKRVLTRTNTGLWLTDITDFTTTQLIAANFYWEEPKATGIIAGSSIVFLGDVNDVRTVYSLLACSSNAQCPTRTATTCDMSCQPDGFCGFTLSCSENEYCVIDTGICVGTGPVNVPKAAPQAPIEAPVACTPSPGLPPGSCQNGTTVIEGNVTLTNGSTVVVTGPILINGDLEVGNSTLTFTDPTNTLQVQGCVALNGGSVQLQVDPTQVHNGDVVTLIVSNGNCLAGEFESIGTTSSDRCVETSATPTYSSNQLNVLFGVEDSHAEGCDSTVAEPLSAGAIAGIVVGVVVAAAAAIIIVVLVIKRQKEKAEEQKVQGKLGGEL